MELRAYQNKILKELSHVPSIALFMDTGTGKTITSLFRFKENPTDKLLIICPKKVVTQWEDVVNKFDPELKIMQFGKSTASQKNVQIAREYDTTDVIIVNFEIIQKLDYLIGVLNNNWTVIVDESHKIKELGTRRAPVKVTQSVLKIGEKTDYKIILTATPTQKQFGGYIDYYTQLRFLGYMTLEHKQFKERYCIEKDLVLPGRPYPIKEIIGYKNTDEIDNLLKNIAKRYVAKHGDFEPQHTKVNIERTKVYPKTKREMVYKEIMLDNVSRKRVGLKTLTSGVIAGYNQFNEPFSYEDNTNKLDWLEEFLTDTDETVAVFYQYNIELKSLEKLLKKLKKSYIIINGATKDKYRELQKDYEVVLGQFQAAAESLDGLQHKSHIMVFYSMPESSLLYKQALGRIDRVGQEKVPMYYYLVMDKTIDSDIYTMIEKKIEFNEAVLDKLLLEE